MEMQLVHLRHAIQALYWPKNSVTQQEADKWLQSFRNTPGAWDVCLALLRQPDLHDIEQEFAANTLKLACQKYQDKQLRGGGHHEHSFMPSYEASQPTYTRRASPYYVSSVCGDDYPRGHTVGKHTSAYCNYAGEKVRFVDRERARESACVYMRESLRNVLAWAQGDAKSTLFPKDLLEPSTIPRVLQELTALYLGAACQHNWKVGSQLSWAIVVLVVRSPAWPVTTLLRDLHTLFSRAPRRTMAPIPHTMSLVCTLYAATLLPEVCSSRFSSVHAARRQEVLSSLRTSPSILELIQSACCLGGNNMDQQLLDLSCKLITSWCTELGCPPAGLDHNNDLLELLYSCVVGHGPAADSATECLAALFTVCGPGHKSSSGSGRRSNPPAPASTSSSGSGSTSASGGHLGGGVGSAFLGVGSQPQWAVVLLGKLLARLPLLLEAMRSALRTLPGSVGEAAPDRSGFGVLTVERRVLLCNVVKAAGVTVLPLVLTQPQKYQCSFNLVADQLLSFLRDADDAVAITSLEFWHEYLSTLLVLPSPQSAEAVITQHTWLLQHLATCIIQRSCLPDSAANKATADARDLPEDVRNMRRELASCLRDVCALLGAECMLRLAAGAAEEQWQLAGAPTDASAWGPNSWLQLESAIYASNVVLGKGPNQGGPIGMPQLVVLATNCLTGHAKLAGTALTLLGGLSWWFEQHLDALPSVLERIVALVQHQDNKLARNAATALKRICSNGQIAAWLAGQHGDFVKALVAVYHQREESSLKPGWSEEQSTEELLLEALCHMVCVCPTFPASSTLLHHLIGPLLDKAAEQLAMVQKHMAQHAAAASAAATGGPPVVVELSSNALLMLAQQAGHAFLGMARVLENLNKNSAGSSASVSERSDDAGSPTSQLVEQIMPRMWDPLQLALVLAVSHPALAQHLLPPCCNLLGACISIAHGGTRDMSSNMLQAVVRVVQQLPPLVLALPCVHKLMQGCVEQLGVYVAVPSTNKRSGGSSSHTAHGKPPVLTNPPPHPATFLGPEAWHKLQQVAQRCLLGGCEVVLSSSESERWDSDRLVQLLEFAKVCGLCCPEVLHSQGLAGPLLQVTLIACTTFNADQCSAVLQWIPVLCAAAYAHPRNRSYMCSPDFSSGYHSGSSRHSSPHAMAAGIMRDELALAAAATAAQRAVMTALAPGTVTVGMGGLLANVEGRPLGDATLELMGQALEHGSGARITLALLMSASGNMPPDAVLPIANCMHSMWILLGTQRFYKWLELAVRSHDTGPVPWSVLKIEARLAFVQDMLHPDNVTDVSCLKRVLKAFCGGKKKGHR